MEDVYFEGMQLAQLSRQVNVISRRLESSRPSSNLSFHLGVYFYSTLISANSPDVESQSISAFKTLFQALTLSLTSPAATRVLCARVYIKYGGKARDYSA